MEWLRSLMTVVAFATFAGIVVWAWSARRRDDFEAAARSVLSEDEADPQSRHSLISRGGNE
jgi:cytochrome c oxidase cbb3-type subunit 4